VTHPEAELLECSARIQAQAEVVDHALTRPALWAPNGSADPGHPPAVAVYNRLTAHPRRALDLERYAWVCQAVTGLPVAWSARTRHDIAAALLGCAAGEPVPLAAARLEFRLGRADPAPAHGAAALAASALLLEAGWRSTLVACLAPDPLGLESPLLSPLGSDETAFVRARLRTMEQRSDAVARFRRREETLRAALAIRGVAPAEHDALLDAFDALDAGELPDDPELRALLAVAAPWRLVAPKWGALAERLVPQLERLGDEEAAETGAARRARRAIGVPPARPVASVIVPAFGDADTIGAVLDGLERQDLAEPFEIVVVASGTDATTDIVTRGHPGTVLLHSPDRLTPGAARNAGVDAASDSDVIAFLAADCIPAPDWLRRRVEAHRRGHALVGGFVDAARPSTCAGWAQYFAKFWGMQGLHRARGEGPGPLFHLSYARSALSQRWDESSVAGEDTAFNDALVRTGHCVWFDADIRVFHVNARRLSTVLAEQREQGHGVGRLCDGGDLARYFVPLRGGPQMPFVLGWRCVASTARHRPRLLARCVAVLPLTVAAMAARRRGFRAGLREGATPSAATPAPARRRAQPAPVVSVIVPAFNEERVIGACVDSLLAQAGPPLEVLVIDDGSTDGTAAVARARHVPVLRLPHGGPAAAKNAGAAAARGEVLVFFDADLVAEPGAVEALCRPILEGRSLGTYTAEIMVGNPDNGWADCWTYNRGAARGVHFPRPLPARWDNFRAVRREDFLRAGGYDDVGYGEDMTLAPKLRGKADAAPGARLRHHNPSTLHEVWENARWVGRGPAIHSGPRPARPRPLRLCLRRGVAGALQLGRPRYVVFALAYDLGVRSGLRSAGRRRASHAK
jgi:glycosyltransferase involved in cell wall biosynthesis